MEEMDREQDSSWLLGGWNFLWVPTLISAARYCSAAAVWAHLLLADGVPWCQGDLFSKELQIHSGKPDQQVGKTTLMPPSKIPVHHCQISGMPTPEQVPPDTL